MEVKTIVIVIVLILFCSCSCDSDETETTDYLQNRYHQEFVRVSEVDKDLCKKENYQFAFTYYSKRNTDITFRAGKKKEYLSFPLPPIKASVFFDDYFEAAEEYYSKLYIGDQIFFLENHYDIAKKANIIYGIMNSINSELNGLGFETSCSITVTISSGNNTQSIRFANINLIYIESELSNFYDKTHND